MPLYEFECQKCNKLFEVIVPMSQSGDVIKCPYCKRKLKKRMSAVFGRVK